MTKQKSLKRRVRARMSKTGERYTAARRHLHADDGDKRSGNDAAGVPGVPDGLTAEQVVVDRTGHGWRDWFVMLEAWGARSRPHREIAAWLRSSQGVDSWWSQQLTVGYEIATGRRVVGQRADGFAASATRTLAVPVERLYRAVVDPAQRRAWLPDAPIEARTARPNRSATFGWDGGTSRVAIGFTDKGPVKSTVAIGHERLPDAKAAARMKAFWRDRLDALEKLLG